MTDTEVHETSDVQEQDFAELMCLLLHLIKSESKTPVPSTTNDSSESFFVPRCDATASELCRSMIQSIDILRCDEKNEQALDQLQKLLIITESAPSLLLFEGGTHLKCFDK